MPWVPPGCLLGASWVPPGCLLGASWEPPGSLLGAFVWGLTLGSYYHIIIPQTELAMGGSNGVGLEGAMKSVRECSLTRSPIFAAIYGTW